VTCPLLAKPRHGRLRAAGGGTMIHFPKEEGFLEEVQAKALKRALAEQLEDSMLAAKLTKMKMAKIMETSRSQLDRVLDPDNVSIQLDTLMKAARALGKTVEIKIRKTAIRKQDALSETSNQAPAITSRKKSWSDKSK
jgi:hypothetical protein